MMRHYNLWFLVILGSFSLDSCGPKPNITVNDYVIGGYEGVAGGPSACTEVHTLFTTIPLAHFNLNDCLLRLVGKVYLDGNNLNSMVSNIDLMCTSLGSCTYQQQIAMLYLKSALKQVELVFPGRKK